MTAQARRPRKAGMLGVGQIYDTCIYSCSFQIHCIYRIQCPKPNTVNTYLTSRAAAAAAGRESRSSRLATNDVLTWLTSETVSGAKSAEFFFVASQVVEIQNVTVCGTVFTPALHLFGSRVRY